MARSFLIRLVLSFAVGTFLVATPRAARADILSSCGNIDVQASATCTLETSGGCTAKCTPPNFEAACAAQLEVTCGGRCTASADVNCTASCSGNCTASCMAQPGMFNCQGSCEADCDGHCDGSCSANANHAQCQASCKASCGSHCNAQCSATPPSASCQAQCMASCSGSCSAQANLGCDVMCQSSGYAMCEATLTGGCQAQCSQPQGALFCDGQYVDTGNNLQQCVDDLKSALNIQAMASASGSCSGNSCQGMASATASSCDVSSVGRTRAGATGLLVASLALGLVAFMSRSRKKCGDFRRDRASPVTGRGAVLTYGDDPRRRDREGIGEKHRTSRRSLPPGAARSRLRGHSLHRWSA